MRDRTGGEGEALEQASGGGQVAWRMLKDRVLVRRIKRSFIYSSWTWALGCQASVSQGIRIFWAHFQAALAEQLGAPEGHGRAFRRALRSYERVLALDK